MPRCLIFVVLMLVLTGCYKEPIDVYIDWATPPDSTGRVFGLISVAPCSYLPFPTKCGGTKYTTGFGDSGIKSDHYKATSYDNYFYLQGKLKGTVTYKFKGKVCGGGAIESNGGAPVEFHFECVIPTQ